MSGMTTEELRIAVESMTGQINDNVGKIREAIAEFDIRIKQAERDGYVGDLYRTRYTVTGRGAFPVDMLRYAVSWPNDEQDARAIKDSIEHGGPDDHWTVRLCKYHRDANPNLCEDRWESKFRWRVLHLVNQMYEIETVRI